MNCNCSQELASLSEKSTEQYKSYEGKIKDMEVAMEQRKQTLEKLEIARDDLTIQLRNLEQNLQEKDLKVEVMFLHYKTRFTFIDLIQWHKILICSIFILGFSGRIAG